MRSVEDLNTVARIRDAAIEQFGQRGFSASVRSIATAAGVSAALVIHHFGSKEKLREACDAYVIETVRVAKTESMQNASVQHQEYRDDRYVAAVKLDGYGTTHLLYLARAVTPGTYRVPPPQVESMYRPAWNAVGGTPERLVVRGAE